MCLFVSMFICFYVYFYALYDSTQEISQFEEKLSCFKKKHIHHRVIKESEKKKLQKKIQKAVFRITNVCVHSFTYHFLSAAEMGTK